MGGNLLTIKNPYRLKIHEYPKWIHTRAAILTSKAPYYLNQLQGERKGILLEIGSGSGQHLLEQARRNPDFLVAGLEVRYKRMVRTAQKAEKEDLQNLVVLQWDGNFFHTLLKPASLDGLFLLFPDPWPKKKHRRRRIFLGSFFSHLAQTLKKNGFFLLKTDHSEYFDHFLETLESFQVQFSPSSRPFQITEITRDLYQSPYLEGNIPTEFEGLFIHKVKEPIKYLKLKKIQPIP
ncbi:MAG: tRNA (guanosine(46)-N7)-methyltransferase TrmB, partial [Planctomycetota bacterium]